MKANPFSTKVIFFGILLVIIFSALGFLLNKDKNYARDYAIYWSGYQALTNHHNPYSFQEMTVRQSGIMEKELIPFVPFSPPHYYLFFCWLYVLPFHVGKIGVGLFNFLCLLGLSVIGSKLFSDSDKSPNLRSVALGLVLMMPFLVVAWYLSVTSTYLILFLLAGIYLLEHQRERMGVFLLSLVTIKVHLFLPILAVLFYLGIRGRKYVLIAQFIFYQFLFAGITEVIFPGIYSNWISSIQGQAVKYINPSLSGMIKNYIWLKYKHLSAIPGLLFSCLGCVYALKRSMKIPRFVWSRELPWLIGVSLVSASYVWFSDFTILFMLHLSCLSLFEVMPSSDSKTNLFRMWIFVFFLVLAGASVMAKSWYYFWAPWFVWIYWERLVVRVDRSKLS